MCRLLCRVYDAQKNEGTLDALPHAIVLAVK